MSKNNYLKFLPVLSFIPAQALAAGYTLLESDFVSQKTVDNATSFMTYVGLIFKALLSLIIILAVVYIVVGGFKYVVGSTVADKSDGKKQIIGAITGLFIALVSWLVLYTINPKLVNWDLTITPLSYNQGYIQYV